MWQTTPSLRWHTNGNVHMVCTVMGTVVPKSGEAYGGQHAATVYGIGDNGCRVPGMVPEHGALASLSNGGAVVHMVVAASARVTGRGPICGHGEVAFNEVESVSGAWWAGRRPEDAVHAPTQRKSQGMQHATAKTTKRCVGANLRSSVVHKSKDIDIRRSACALDHG